MIKGIFLDVDGVLVGGKEGYNWPLPHSAVIEKLKVLRGSGVIITLCTGKGIFAIADLVKKIGLDTLQIGDGGAEIINVVKDQIFQTVEVEKKDIIELIALFQKHHVYVELYSAHTYATLSSTVCDITEKHAKVLYHKPELLTSYEEFYSKHPIIKLMPIAQNQSEKEKVTELFKPFTHKLTLQWGTHPAAGRYEFGMVTAKGISKGKAVEQVAAHYGLSLDSSLGVGDSFTDWDFIKRCGYGGAMGNASEELKRVVKTHPHGYIGEHIDESGLLSIFSHFGL